MKDPTALVSQMKVLVALIQTRRGLTRDDMARAGTVTIPTIARYIKALDEADCLLLCEKVAGEYRYWIDGVESGRKARRTKGKRR